MSEFAIPVGAELFLFMLTVVVGYVTLAVAYDYVGRLNEWREFQAFDKAILTFLVGGVVTTISYMLTTWDKKEAPVFLEYITQNAILIFVLDLVPVGPILGYLIGRFFLAKSQN
jgi:phage-related holin